MTISTTPQRQCFTQKYRQSYIYARHLFPHTIADAFFVPIANALLIPIANALLTIALLTSNAKAQLILTAEPLGLPTSTHLGLDRTMLYIRYIYSVFGREITEYTAIYGVHIRPWPALHIPQTHTHTHTQMLSYDCYSVTHLTQRCWPTPQLTHIHIPNTHTHTCTHTYAHTHTHTDAPMLPFHFGPHLSCD